MRENDRRGVLRDSNHVAGDTPVRDDFDKDRHRHLR
jgi:hypothetical protein